MVAAFDDASGFQHDELVGRADGGEPVAMTIEVRPSSASASAAWTAASDVESRWAVASSRITTDGSASSSRAMVMRWRSPPDRR